MGYEHEVIHPATAQWLEQNGYTYRHEVQTDAGNIDFLATHSDGHHLIVECKSRGSSYLSALRQVLDYQRELGSAFRASIAMPESDITPEIETACIRRNVGLIRLSSLGQFDRTKHNLDSIIGIFFCLEAWKMIDFHTKNNTSPVYDMFLLTNIILAAPFNNPPDVLRAVIKACHDKNPELVSSAVKGITPEEAIQEPSYEYYFAPRMMESFLLRIALL
jgi:hypothetical protein